jgi:hypothetical protein
VLQNAEAGCVRHPELACVRVAGRQHGLVSHTQALAEGMTPRQVELRIRSGAWVRVLPSVYRIAGTPRSEDQEVMAATIWAGEGSSASGRCAARMWEPIEGPARGASRDHDSSGGSYRQSDRAQLLLPQLWRRHASPIHTRHDSDEDPSRHRPSFRPDHLNVRSSARSIASSQTWTLCEGASTSGRDKGVLARAGGGTCWR